MVCDDLRSSYNDAINTVIDSINAGSGNNGGNGGTSDLNQDTLIAFPAVSGIGTTTVIDAISGLAQNQAAITGVGAFPDYVSVFENSLT